MQITINLTEREYEVLKELSIKKDLPEEKLVLQALRIYQLIDNHWNEGHRICWMDSNGNLIPDIVGGCGGE